MNRELEPQKKESRVQSRKFLEGNIGLWPLSKEELTDEFRDIFHFTRRRL